MQVIFLNIIFARPLNRFDNIWNGLFGVWYSLFFIYKCKTSIISITRLSLSNTRSTPFSLLYHKNAPKSSILLAEAMLPPRVLREGHLSEGIRFLRFAQIVARSATFADIISHFNLLVNIEKWKKQIEFSVGTVGIVLYNINRVLYNTKRRLFYETNSNFFSGLV